MTSVSLDVSASVSLDDIWDVPIESTTPRKTPVAIDIDAEHTESPRPTKRPRQALFLASDSEDDVQTRQFSRPTNTHVARSEIDALFDDLDVPEQLGPSLDLDALRREADARNAKALSLTPHQIFPSSPPAKGDQDNKEEDGKGGKKGKSGKDGQKRSLPKLDEARLLGPNGFPALVKQTKGFKPRGKGHEASDLNRLLQVYQFWTHKMYPKTQFRDTVDRVERLCHSKRMHVALGVWRDESKGLINGRKFDEPIDLTSDADDDSSDDGRNIRTKPDANRSSPARASSPPSSTSAHTSMGADDDFDIDAIIAEEEARRAAQSHTQPRSPQPSAPARPVYVTREHVDVGREADDDEAMWDELMGGLDDTAILKPAAPHVPQAQSSGDQDEDEDMWDIVREMEADTRALVPEIQKISSALPETQDAKPSADSTNDDEYWDDMYL